ncbi:alpha/beta hydrolase family protein [Corynebacterium sp. HS2168-gen11]|uniref:alpha/beta hydrolase n=1 Tax=Corynebacterium sp. HS2168-gen11 TaxID=2974027 RepID=UPI00216B2308|nr:alpha/beta hydrolase family protein [Corynebacterium sp. HS2168-gen11]MCS4535609.1 esterase family protein [Corynebacterium sp. HS2168-gen11]
MKILHRLAAVLCAAAVSTATPAFASPVAPAQLAGNAEVSQLTVGKNLEQSFAWQNTVDGQRVLEVWASSPAMDNRQVPLLVIKAQNPHRPVLYLLNGGDGGEGRANWVAQTDVIDFYKSKDINVVIPMAGKFSYYTDWQQPEPVLGGKQMWETFLTRELPGPIENLLQANGRRAIAGMSMSATSALLLAEHNPRFYDATAAFSGCYASSKPVPWLFTAITLQRGLTTPDKMWGPFGSPAWVWNDAMIQAEGLRGTEVYVSSGSGLAGEWDLPNGPRLRFEHPLVQSIASTSTIVEGGIIEGATNACTHDLKVKLDKLNIPVQWNFRDTGTHSWGYWQTDLRDSWPVFERAFNRPE